MKKDTNKLYDKIMESVSKQIKKTLDEVVITSDGSLQPKKVELPDEAYVIFCSGLSSSTAKTIASIQNSADHTDLTGVQTRPYGPGAVNIFCKTYDNLKQMLNALLDIKCLDDNNSLGSTPRIAIQKVSKTSMNDSVNEAKEDTERIRIARQYMDPKKFWTPRQPAKLEIIQKINAGEMERTPEAIRAALDATGLWADAKEGRIKMDVDLIMKKTGEKIQREEPMEGEFITDYIYSRDSLEAEKWQRPYDCAVNHAKWLVNKGLDVRVEEGRYSYKYYITYHTKKQFDELVQWMAWHSGYTYTVNAPCPKEDKQYFIDIIKSGKKTTW